MKKIFLALALPSLALAQGSLASNIKTKITELKTNKVDTLLVFQEECNGCISMPDCRYEGLRILFWKKDAEFFYQKFSECKVFEVTKINQNNPLAYYLRYQNRVDKEKIKDSEYTYFNKLGEKEIMTSTASHSRYYNFYFQINDKIIEKTVSKYQLNLKELGENQPNTHYKSNHKTHLAALINQMKQYTKLLD